MKWMARISGVHPKEARRTMLATAFYFFFVAHVVMLKSASNALFLSRHDPKYLPHLYILVALLVAFVVTFCSHALADPKRKTMRLVGLLASAAILVACWLVLLLDAFPISPFIYLFGEIAVTVLNIQFWSVAGDLFDPQEGKRVFGILAGGGMSGSIAGGLFVHHAGSAFGAPSLLLCAAGFLILCTVFARALLKEKGWGRTKSTQSEVTSIPKGLRYVYKNAYPRTFAILMLVSVILTSFIDYSFRLSAQEFLNEDQLASLFGDLNFYVGILSALFLLLFSKRILHRIGIFYYLLIVPCSLLLSLFAAIAFPSFLTIYALKIIETSGSLSINQAGLQLLYNPMPSAQRNSARSVVDGFARKLGFAVGGIILIIISPYLINPLENTYWQILLFSCILLFIAVLFRLRTLFVGALNDKLHVGAQGSSRIRLEDAHTRKLLVFSLYSQDPNQIETSLKLLSGVKDLDIRKPLSELIKSQNSRVRIASIRAIWQRSYKEFHHDLIRIIQKSDNRMERLEATMGLLRLDPKHANEVFSPFLKSSDPNLLAIAIYALIRLHGYQHLPAITALERILEQGSDAPKAHRIEVAQLLGQLGEGRYTQHLLIYLNDPDTSVRQAAAQSCTGIHRSAFVERLLLLLSDRETRIEARDALASYKDRILDILEESLNNRRLSLSIRIRIPRILRMIGTQRAGEALLFSNIQDDANLRYRIAIALSSIRLNNPKVSFDRNWALEAFQRRLDSYVYYANSYRPIAAYYGSETLLTRAIEERLTQNLEIAFRLLGLVFPHRALMSIYHHVKSLDANKLPFALELLDNIVDHDSRDRLVPILEQHRFLIATSKESFQHRSIEPVQEAVLQLTHSKDTLIRCVATHRLRKEDDSLSDLEYPELYEGVSTVDVLEKVLFLESVEIFKQNNLDDLSALAAIAKEKRFKKGQHILKEGQPGDALYIITKGLVEVTKGGRTLLTLGEKSSLGGVSLLDRKPNAAGAICSSDCEILVIERTDFMDLLSDRVELLHGIFLALTDRLRAMFAVTEGGTLSKDCQSEDAANPI